MDETEFRQAMTGLAEKYPVDEIDPRVGSGTWTDKQVLIFQSRLPNNTWNNLLARDYYRICKNSIEEFVRTHKRFLNK